MCRKVYRPSRWETDEEWLKYIATRIEWTINLADYGISETHSVSLSKEGDVTIITIDGFFDTKSIKTMKLNAALYDTKGYIKDSVYLYNDVIKEKHEFSFSLKAKDIYKFDKIVIIGIVREAEEADMLHYLAWNYEFRNLPDLDICPSVRYNNVPYYDYEGPVILDELRVEYMFFGYIEDANLDITLYDDNDNIKDTKNITEHYICDGEYISCVLKAKTNLLKLKKIVISGKIKRKF